MGRSLTGAAALLAAARLACASGFPYTLPLLRLPDDGMVGNVTMGSPPQPLSVQVDTLSSDLWVPAPESGMPTPLHHVFTSGLSATYHDDGANMTLPYSPRLNASVCVEVSEDTLAMAGLAVNVTFGVATAMDTWFYAAGFDGILGLGLDGAGRISRTTVLDRLVHQRGLEPMFSMFVAPSKLQQQAAGAQQQQQRGWALQQALAKATAGAVDEAAAAAATVELDAKPSAESALLLGGYDMRYAYAPKERPLWIPLLDLGAPAPAPLLRAEEPLAPTDADGVAAPASPPLASGSAAGAGAGMGSTTWRVWLPHFTLDCGAPASSSGAATLSRGWRALSGWASAAQSPTALGDGSDACVGSAAYVAWAAAAIPALRPHFVPFPVHAPAPQPTRRHAAQRSVPRHAAPLRDAPGSLDVCGYDAPSDSTLCSGMITSSIASLGVPGVLLPTLVAAVNVSCGGQCVVVPGVGAGLLCPLGTCGDTALPGGGVVPAGMPRLTLTLSTAGSPGGDPTADGSDLTDVPLMPADYTRVLAAELARAAARRALDEAVAAAAASGGAGELPSWAADAARVAGDTFPAAYWRVMVQPFDPYAGDGGDDLPWLLGTPFLSAFYTVFDASGMQLGFAPTVAAHEPSPSRYIEADTGAGFWGRPVMWAAVVSALFVGLGCVGSFYVARHRRHARRAEAVEEEHRERLLLGVQLDAPGEADGSGGGGGGSAYEYEYATLGPDGGDSGGGYTGEHGGSHRLVDDGVVHGSGGSVVFYGGRGGVGGGSDYGGGHRQGPTIIGLHGVGQAGARPSYAPQPQQKRQQPQQPTFGSGFGVSLGAYSSGSGAGASYDGVHANGRGAGGGGGAGPPRGLQRPASSASASSPGSPGSDAGTSYLRIAAPASGGGTASGRGGTPRYLAAGGSDSPSQSPQQGLAGVGSVSPSRGVLRRAATPLGGGAGSPLPGGVVGGANPAAVAHAARRLDFNLGGGQPAGAGGSLTPGAGRRAPSTSGETLHGLGGLASPLVGSLPPHVVGSAGSGGTSSGESLGGGGGAGGGSYYFDA